jgi:hypothetical protein
MFEKPLLRLEANGDRYFIARHSETSELALVHEDREGGYSWSVLGDGHASSAEPWSNWVVAGRLPHRARQVVVVLDGGPSRTTARSGIWMASLPGDEIQAELRFLDSAGRVVETRELQLPAAGP